MSKVGRHTSGATAAAAAAANPTALHPRLLTPSNAFFGGGSRVQRNLPSPAGAPARLSGPLKLLGVSRAASTMARVLEGRARRRAAALAAAASSDSEATSDSEAPVTKQRVGGASVAAVAAAGSHGAARAGAAPVIVRKARSAPAPAAAAAPPRPCAETVLRLKAEGEAPWA